MTGLERAWKVPRGILCMILGCIAIYSALFGAGQWIYANYGLASALTALAVVSSIILVKLWSKLIEA